MAAVALGGLTLIFGCAVFLYGAVLPEHWYPCLAGLGLTGAVYWLTAGRFDRPPSLPWALRILPAALLAISLLQLVPLPVGVVEILSPARAELHAALPEGVRPEGWIPLSIKPAAAMEGTLRLAGYLLVFFLVADLGWRLRDRPWALAAPFVLVGLLQAVLGLVQSWGFGMDVARGSYVNRNHFAGLLEMCLPFAALYGVALLQRGRRENLHRSPAGPAIKACFWLAVAAAMLTAVLHSLSRMGFLAVLSSLFVMGAVAAGGGLSGRKRWLPIAAAGALVVAGFLFLPTDRLIERFASIAQTEEITADTRAEIWRDTVKLIGAYPVAGCGLGCYESGLYPFKSVAPMNTIDMAHNDYLQLMAEFGLPGFAVLMLLAARTFGRALRAAGAEAGTDERYLGIACVGSLAAIALHSLVDFNLYIPANALLLAWVAGLAESLTHAAAPERARRGSRRGNPLPTYVDATGVPVR